MQDYSFHIQKAGYDQNKWNIIEIKLFNMKDEIWPEYTFHISVRDSWLFNAEPSLDYRFRWYVTETKRDASDIVLKLRVSTEAIIWVLQNYTRFWPEAAITLSTANSMQKDITVSIKSVDAEESNDKDDMVKAAMEIKVHGKASATMLQRNLNRWFAQASRIMDMIEDAGLVWPLEWSKPREIFHEKLDEYING